MELVRFDMQLMENPGISRVEYQQGCLAGYQVKEYLLEKWGRACVYCGKKDTPLEVEHIVPKSRGGSNRISNLTISCVALDQKKNAQSIEPFLTRRPELLEKMGLIIRWATNELTRYMALQPFVIPTLCCNQLKDWHRVAEVMINPEKIKAQAKR